MARSYISELEAVRIFKLLYVQEVVTHFIK